jgi:hypothetical protein
MKEFLKYYFKRPLRDDGNGKMWFTLNHLWLFGSLLFIGLCLHGVYKYQAPIFYMWAFIPFVMMIYNFVDEYHCFKGVGNSKRTAYIAYGLVALDVFIMILILFINKTN